MNDEHDEAEHARRIFMVQPSSSEAWKGFVLELTTALRALEEDEFLIISVKKTNRFVQFAAQGSFGMRAEVTSDFYLPEEEQLSKKQYSALLQLGWNAPSNLPDQLEPGRGHKSDGSPNYFLDIARPVPFELLAQLAVATFRGVFGAGHPGNLQYSAFGEGRVSIRFPHLGVRRRLGDSP
jgi:hypothetical protein